MRLTINFIVKKARQKTNGELPVYVRFTLHSKRGSATFESTLVLFINSHLSFLYKNRDISPLIFSAIFLYPSSL